VRTVVQLKSSLSEAETAGLRGKRGRIEDASVVLRDAGSVYKPGGQRLLTLVRGAIAKPLIDAAFPFVWSLREYKSMNRGAYAGTERENGDLRQKVSTGMRYRAIKRDGTISNTNHAPPVASALLGFFDRNPRFPYCRETVFTTNDPDRWARSLPFIQRVGELFREVVPDRYATQIERASQTHPAYVIPHTPFTTLTVNNTVSGAYHTDKGDYGPGFGVMVVFRKGVYRGCELIFPKYGVATDMQHGDVIFFDPHELHGNTPFIDGDGEEGEDWARISMVFYYRDRMIECLEPSKELERAKMARGRIAASE
jgi:2-oxoglutarate-Fe(II)-dependent dioxygenase family protein